MTKTTAKRLIVYSIGILLYAAIIICVMLAIIYTANNSDRNSTPETDSTTHALEPLINDQISNMTTHEIDVLYSSLREKVLDVKVIAGAQHGLLVEQAIDTEIVKLDEERHKALHPNQRLRTHTVEYPEDDTVDAISIVYTKLYSLHDSLLHGTDQYFEQLTASN